MSFMNVWQSVERWAPASLMSKETKLRVNPSDLSGNWSVNVAPVSSLPAPHCGSRSVCRMDRSQGKYLALLLYSPDSLYWKATYRRICQELSVPLPTKSFNRGLNVSNQTDIDFGRVVKFGAVNQMIQSAWLKPFWKSDNLFNNVYLNVNIFFFI